jgi:hypothetical protein
MQALIILEVHKLVFHFLKVALSLAYKPLEQEAGI